MLGQGGGPGEGPGQGPGEGPGEGPGGNIQHPWGPPLGQERWPLELLGGAAGARLHVP